MVAKNGSFIVDKEEAGQRLEQVVRRRLNLSLAQTRALFAAKGVSIAGRAAARGIRVNERCVVQLRQASFERRVLPSSQPKLIVKRELPWMLAIEKPAGQPCHVLRPEETNTVVNALVSSYPEVRDIGYSWREPGLVHRLDTFTSGLLLVARNQRAFDALTGALKQGAMIKRYLALVDARRLPSALPCWIEVPLGPQGQRGQRVTVDPGGYPAASRLLRAVRFQKTRWALVEVEARHAYRHQVRAHLAHVGCPILGDLLYGGTKIESLMRGNASRHALHASYVAWSGDEHFAGFRIRSELPSDLRRVAEGGV